MTTNEEDQAYELPAPIGRTLAAAPDHQAEAPSDDVLSKLSDAARPGPWLAYETMQADNFIVEESQGLLRGPGPVMGPSYDKSTTEYVVALVNAHRAGALAARPVVDDEPKCEHGIALSDLCELVSRLTNAEPVVDDAAVERALAAWRWHSNGVAGMRAALRAALGGDQ